MSKFKLEDRPKVKLNILKVQKDDENDPDHRVCDVVQLDEVRGVIAGIGALYSAGSRELSIIKQLIDTLPMISFRAVPCKRETENG